MSRVTFQSDTEDIWKILCNVRGKLAFDIGANGGLVSRELSHKFESVVAIEPCTESYAHLLSGLPANVKPLNVAISARPGFVSLRETSLTARWGELFTDDTLPWGEHLGYREVPAVTLDTLTDLYGTPDFVKIDTEGHEVQVVRAGGTTLMDHGCRFVIECHSEAKGAEVQECLRVLNRDFVLHHHEAYRPGGIRDKRHYWVTSPAGEFVP